MGDRCWLQVTVHARDVDRFREITGRDEKGEDNGHGHRRLEYEEANYGLFSELNEAAQQGLRFEGQHGPGDDYGPAVFASAGDGICHNVEADRESWPVVRIEDNGRPDRGQWRAVLDYQRARKQVREILKQPVGVDALKEAVGDE